MEAHPQSQWTQHANHSKLRRASAPLAQRQLRAAECSAAAAAAAACMVEQHLIANPSFSITAPVSPAPGTMMGGPEAIPPPPPPDPGQKEEKCDTGTWHIHPDELQCFTSQTGHKKGDADNNSAR